MAARVTRVVVQDVHVRRPSETVQSCVAVKLDCILNFVELFLRLQSNKIEYTCKCTKFGFYHAFTRYPQRCEPRLYRDHASHGSYGVPSCASRGDCRSLHGDTVRCSGVQCVSGDSAPPIRPYSQTKRSLVS